MGERKKSTKKKVAYPFRYDGNKIILILFVIIWLPIGLVLLMQKASFLTGNSRYFLRYHGDYVWLYLWSIVFFPVTFALLLLNGADVLEEHE
ncbi:MAG: hypothetical protein NTW08_06035 [Gammaproteobacteria bacterium]|nr:hypothetical protein [Gammaproteobacteria bacterium]